MFLFSCVCVYVNVIAATLLCFEEHIGTGGDEKLQCKTFFISFFVFSFIVGTEEEWVRRREPGDTETMNNDNWRLCGVHFYFCSWILFNCNSNNSWQDLGWMEASGRETVWPWSRFLIILVKFEIIWQYLETFNALAGHGSGCWQSPSYKVATRSAHAKVYTYFEFYRNPVNDNANGKCQLISPIKWNENIRLNGKTVRSDCVLAAAITALHTYIHLSSSLCYHSYYFIL